MKDRIAHDVEGFIRGNPFIHRHPFLDVQTGITVPADEPINGWIVGNIEPPEQSMARAATFAHDDLSPQAL